MKFENCIESTAAVEESSAVFVPEKEESTVVNRRVHNFALPGRPFACKGNNGGCCWEM